jgi:hypothetical protein
MRITSTFLDEITHDIPSNNWVREEWADEFKIMKSIGIDTAVILWLRMERRCGCADAGNAVGKLS